MRRSLGILVILTSALLVMASSAHANWMGNFQLEHGDTAYLGNSQQASVTFDFSLTNHVCHFVAIAYYQGRRVRNIITTPTTSYAGGTQASETLSMTFDAGEIDVDQYVIQMVDLSSHVWLEMRLPVTYHFGANAINNIQMDFSSPSWIQNETYLHINFHAQTDETHGAKIIARPYYQGVLIGGYVASDMVTQNYGSGENSQYFTYNTGFADIDAIHFVMRNSSLITTLLEFSVPVDLHWGPNQVANITLSPKPGSDLLWDQDVTVEFDYKSSDSGGCYLYALPLDGQQNNILGAAHDASPLMANSGHASRHFHFGSIAGDDQSAYVKILMANSDNRVTLLNAITPNKYYYGSSAVSNIVMTPLSPAVLDTNQLVMINFDYDTDYVDGMDVNFFPRYHEQTIHYSAHLLGPTHFGSGSSFSGVSAHSEPALATSIELVLSHGDDSSSSRSFQLPCNYTWVTYYDGTGGVTPVGNVPTAGPVLGQNYPNPFNPMTHIPVDVDKEGPARIQVYDVAGHLVRTVFDGIMTQGHHNILLDGKGLSSGAYFYTLKTAQGRQTKRMLLVK